MLYTERKKPGVPGLPVMSVTLDRGLVPRESLERRVESELAPTEHALARPGDLVYNTMRMWQGGSGIASSDCIVSPAYVVASPNERIAPSFAGYLFKSPRVIASLFSYSHGITRDRLRLYFENFQEVPVILPPLPQQDKIAAILSSVDEAIAATRKVIEQTERVKQGLLQTLMTRGIGHTRFKQTEIGEIPEAWEVVRFGDVCHVVSGQVDPREEPFRSLPLIAPNHLESGSGRLIEVETAGDQGAISGKYEVHPGQVVYSKIRPYLRKAWLADRRATCSADMYPIVSNSRIEPAFLVATLLGETFARFADAVSMRTGIPKINREDLAEYRMPVPPAAEQREIVRRVSLAGDAVARHRVLSLTLETLKRGLMQDLLTGRVRVQPD